MKALYLTSSMLVGGRNEKLNSKKGKKKKKTQAMQEEPHSFSRQTSQWVADNKMPHATYMLDV
eukprot:m.177596 g.177596  ORF g.177596 m.177596 type:complete len:63 (-) comp16574_c0_seq4:1200-1388(-)